MSLGMKQWDCGNEPSLFSHKSESRDSNTMDIPPMKRMGMLQWKIIVPLMGYWE